jgi:hypothetical protein
MFRGDVLVYIQIYSFLFVSILTFYILCKQVHWYRVGKLLWLFSSIPHKYLSSPDLRFAP